MPLAAKRIGLIACVLASMFALGTSLASAAGKPTSVTVSNTHEINGYNVMEFTAKVNPNGANTATYIEISGAGGGWTKGAAHNFSGTTIRTYSEEFRVNPGAKYEVRVTATNLYGSTSSTVANFTALITTTGEKELKELPVSSAGVASFAMTFAGVPIFVTCGESSYGSIGNSGGLGDVLNYSMYNCLTFINGKASPKCNVKDFNFALKGAGFALVGSPGFIPLRPVTEGCALETYWQVYPESFRVVDNGGAEEYGKGRPIVLTAPAKLYKNNPAEVTIESEWFLSAEYMGTPFKFANIES
jgi:hypothetical protein